MTSPDTSTKELEKAVVMYRVKCDMAVSDRDEGVYTQKEYEKAIQWELDRVMSLFSQALQSAKKDCERAVAEALKDHQNCIKPKSWKDSDPEKNREILC